MVTLHEGKQFIINNDHIASAEEAAKLSEEAEGNINLAGAFQAQSFGQYGASGDSV